MKLFWPFANRRDAAPANLPCFTHPNVDPELTRNAAGLLRSVGCDEMAGRVAVAWHKRLSSTAGFARPAQAIVLLNPRLAIYPEEIDRTLRHELAHLLAHARSRGRRITAHGPEWKMACGDLGIPGESRCHSLPLPRRQVTRRHVYKCPRCHFLLKRVRPIKPRRQLACMECCKRHANGRYDRRFAFVHISTQAPAEILSPHPAPDALRIESLVQQTLNFQLPMKESTQDKIRGAVNEVSGKVKEKVGEKANDPNLQDEGTVEKVKGKVQGKIGDIKKVFEK